MSSAVQPGAGGAPGGLIHGLDRASAWLNEGLAWAAAAMLGAMMLFSVVDMVARKTLRQITMPADSRPMGIVVTPDGKRVYVSNGRGKTVSVIDPATDAVTATVEVGMRPWGIALSGDGRKLYTANGPGNDVTVIDTETMTVLKRIPAGTIPWGVAVGPRP